MGLGIRIFEPMLVLIFIFHDLKTEVMFEAEVMVDTDVMLYHLFPVLF